MAAHPRPPVMHLFSITFPRSPGRLVILDLHPLAYTVSFAGRFPHFTPKKESVPRALDDFPLIGPEPKTKGLRAQTVLVQCTFNRVVWGPLQVTKHCALDLGYSPTKYHMFIGQRHFLCMYFPLEQNPGVQSCLAINPSIFLYSQQVV